MTPPRDTRRRLGRTPDGQRVDASLDELTADLEEIGLRPMGTVRGPFTSSQRVRLGELILMDPTAGSVKVYIPAVKREDVGRQLTITVASTSTTALTIVPPAGVRLDNITGDATYSGAWASLTLVVTSESDWLAVQAGGTLSLTTNTNVGGRPAVLINDFEFAETGSSYVTKLSSRYVRQADLPPDGWRVMAGMWRTGGAGTASLEVEYGGDTLELTSTDTSEELQSGTLSFDNAAEDTLDTWTIKLKLTGGGTDARFKYLSIYEEF